MSRYSSPSLLAPPREEEDVYPYRRVWPSIAFEAGLLFAAAMGLYILSAFLGLTVPSALTLPANLIVALLPAGFWLIFSYVRERRVPQPRTGLMPVFVVSALVANSITIPLLDTIQPDQWLPRVGTIDRVLGYTLSVGIIHEALKYVILRYMIWPGKLRIRLDALAYSAASAIGYVTMLNIHMALQTSPATDAMAARVFANVVIHLAGSAIVAYGLSEMHFNSRIAMIMPLILLLAALVHGIVIPTRAGLINANFLLGIGATRPIFGLIFSLVLVVVAMFSIGFLFNAAERQEREAIASREV